MGTKHLSVLIHIRNNGKVGTVKHVKPSSNFLMTVPRRCFFCGPFLLFVPRHEISNNVICDMCDQQRLIMPSYQPAHTRCLIRAFAIRLNIQFGVKRRLHRFIRVYTCQNTTLLEITCRGSIVFRVILS